MPSPTLTDVAKEAGVSYATADRVVNKRGNVADKSVRKVQDAVAKLGYVRDVAAARLSRGRRDQLAFVMPAGSNAFYRSMRAHLNAAAPHLQAQGVDIHIIDIPAFDVRGLCEALTGLVGAGFDGAAIVGLDSETLLTPLENLRNEGVELVALVSDLPKVAQAPFIGIDNERAGRTAARLIGLAHGGQAGTVQTIAGSLEARDHRDRLAGFETIIKRDFPKITLLETVFGRDEADNVYDLARKTRVEHQCLSAVYNAGAGNSGLIRALRDGPGPAPICVVHELTDASRQALRDNLVNFVIDQRADVEISNALSHLRTVIDAQPLPPCPISFRPSMCATTYPCHPEHPMKGPTHDRFL